jgi:hypothetical protein
MFTILHSIQITEAHFTSSQFALSSYIHFLAVASNREGCPLLLPCFDAQHLLSLLASN